MKHHRRMKRSADGGIIADDVDSTINIKISDQHGKNLWVVAWRGFVNVYQRVY